VKRRASTVSAESECKANDFWWEKAFIRKQKWKEMGRGSGSTDFCLRRPPASTTKKTSLLSDQFFLTFYMLIFNDLLVSITL